MSKARDIADLGSNDVLETTATGVDVTGTVQADGLDLPNGGFLNSARNSGSLSLPILGHPSGSDTVRYLSSDGHSFVNGSLTKALQIANNGDVSFYEDTGTTAKMVWDASAESLGIGTSPSHALHINTTATAGRQNLEAIDKTSQNLIKVTNPQYATDASAGMVFRVFPDTDARQGAGVIASGGGSNNSTDISLFVTDASAVSYAPYRIAGQDGTHTFYTAPSTERMRIDSAGNVGIGTASPSANLDIEDTTPVIRLSGNGNNADNFNYGEIQFYNLDTSGAGAQIGASIHCETASSAGARGQLVFSTNDASGVEGEDASEAMRIDSSGNLLVGTTTSSSKWVAGNGVDRGFEARGAGLIVSHTSYENQLLNTDNITAHIRFYYRGSATGSINTSGSGTVYATTSDYRLKENVVSMDNASDRVKALKPCRFNFIADPDSTVDGFLAHEAQEVVPEAVTGTKDAMDEDGNPEYQGIDQSKLVPLLTKALQEALTKIEQLETRIETLENN